MPEGDFPTSVDSATGERIQKILARAGYGSRRYCEHLIDSGRVTKNGSPARLGDRAIPGADLLEVDGVPVFSEEVAKYYLVNKPRGYISSARDDRGRPTVVSLISPAGVRLYPVGRLDLDSEGLILVTNDGLLTQFLLHPKHHVEKEYLVEVDKPLRAGIGKAMREGVVEGGQLLKARKVSVVGEKALRVVLVEGRNRQIRRMLDTFGYTVIRLVRTRIGPLSDPGMAVGSYRELTPEELTRLRQACAQRLS
jgi:23S rRNA pseudouridine2605 synthase